MTSEGLAPPVAREKPVYTNADRWLLLGALVIGVLFDRLMVASVDSDTWFQPMASLFWLGYLGVFCAFNWQKVKGNTVAWIAAGLTAALCLWSFLFDYRTAYGYLTIILVIPCALMAHAQFVWGGFNMKQAGATALYWLFGWTLRPFSALGVFFGSLGSLWASDKHANLRKGLLGAAIALPLLLIVGSLLAGADKVFSYYLSDVLSRFYFPSFVGHILWVVAAGMLFYSFIWNARFAKPFALAFKEGRAIDGVIAAVVLGSVLVVYAAFCGIQFTYLFARAGLPGGMSYSEYAREGFAQLITVAGINLALFGVFLHYGKGKALRPMLGALLAVTALMLVSGGVRLNLYVQAYGLTWLRLISAWFMVFIAAVLVLCAVRMARPRLPLMAVSALILLGWYVALGFMSPDALIVRYNLATQNGAEWVDADRSHIYGLSDDAMLALMQSGLKSEGVTRVAEQAIKRAQSRGGISLSSHRALRAVEQYLAENGASK